MVQSVSYEQDLVYNSKITDSLLVMGTEDMEEFEKARADTTKKIIGTHSDYFHCDEVLATTMLLYTDAYKSSVIVRTRQEDVFDRVDILCDVGGVYDPAKQKYDHHQKTFTETWNNEQSDITKLSSAGLVFRHFGKEVITNAIKEIWNTQLEPEMLEKVYQETYKKLILEVDALDNGVSCADDMLYSVKTGLGSRVGRYNTNWNAPKSTSQHEQFKKAMKVCEEELLWALKGTVMVKVPAYGIVKKAFEDRKNFHASGEIMQMEGGACPWKEHLLDLEADAGCKG